MTTDGSQPSYPPPQVMVMTRWPLAPLPPLLLPFASKRKTVSEVHSVVASRVLRRQANECTASEWRVVTSCDEYADSALSDQTEAASLRWVATCTELPACATRQGVTPEERDVLEGLLLQDPDLAAGTQPHDGLLLLGAVREMLIEPAHAQDHAKFFAKALAWRQNVLSHADSLSPKLLSQLRARSSSTAELSQGCPFFRDCILVANVSPDGEKPGAHQGRVCMVSSLPDRALRAVHRSLSCPRERQWAVRGCRRL